MYWSIAKLHGIYSFLASWTQTITGDPKPDTWRTIQCSSLNIDRPADMTTDQGPRYCLCNATGTNVDHPGDVEFQGGSCSYITRLRMIEFGN